MSCSEQIKCCVDNTICKLSSNINRRTAMSQANWIPLDTRGPCISQSSFQNQVLLNEFYPTLFAISLLHMSFFLNLFWTMPILFLPHTSQISYNLTTSPLPSLPCLPPSKHPVFQFSTRIQLVIIFFHSGIFIFCIVFIPS